jgi:uncharacterized protein (TIGR03437 family)
MKVLICLLVLPALAQQQIITTVVGTDWLPAIEGKRAVDVPFGTFTHSLAADSDGNLYFADTVNLVVVKVGRDGIAHVVAGNSLAPTNPILDGVQATSASIYPLAVALDAAGDVYLSDGALIRKVGRDGVLSTIVGPGRLAPNASVFCLSFDASNNLLFCDINNNQVYKLSPNGTIALVAGRSYQSSPGQQTYSGDGGPAVSASLCGPAEAVSDRSGTLYIADSCNNVVRRVTPDGTISTFAGNGTQPGYAGDGGPATAARLGHVTGVALDSAGNFFLSDACGIRMIDRSGIIHTVAGNDVCTHAGDGGPPLQASFYYAEGITFDAAGRLVAVEAGTGQIRAITLGSSVETIAGNSLFQSTPDGTPGTQAFLVTPMGVAADAAGNLYVADTQNCVIRRRTPDGLVQKIAGQGLCSVDQSEGGPALTVYLFNPYGLAVAPNGELAIASTGSNRIFRLGSDGMLRAIAGRGGFPGFGGDRGPALQADLAMPVGIAFDGAGNLYVADQRNNRVRKISTDGMIATFAGTGAPQSTGDGGPAAAAALNSPDGVAVDGAGNVYIAELTGCRIRKVTRDGRIATIAGNGACVSRGDGGPAAQAGVGGVGQMTFDGQGNLYFSERPLNRVRVITSTGMISTVAGSGTVGFSGDLGLAASAELNQPHGVAVGPDGTLFIADANNNRVRAVTRQAPSAQVSTTAMTFSASSGGSLPPPQRIVIQAGGAALPYTATATSQDGTWLTLQSAGGLTPAAIIVSADPSNLTPGIHNGVLTIRIPNATPQSLAVNVTFSVGPALPPKLSIDNSRLSFVTTQRGASAQGIITVGNTGGNSLNFQAATTTDWLTVTPATGSATPVAASRLNLTANPGTMPPGVYRDNVTVGSSTTGEQVSLPVTLLISSQQSQTVLSQSGMAFQAAATGGPPPPQNLSVLNRGQGSMAWTATAKSDPSWLTISQTSGSVGGQMLDASTIVVSADPTGLDPGQYYGQITVSAGGSIDTQAVTVVLNVLADGKSLPPQVLPAALLFTGRPGVAPGSQNLAVRNGSPVPLTYNSARLTLDGADWLQYIPNNARIAANQPQRVVVQPAFAGLSPGVHEGSITFLFGDGSIGVVRVSSVVAAPGCTPTRLIMLPVSVQQVFKVTQYLPQSIEAQVMDDCGVPLTAARAGAAVTASFSNGDRTISLVPTGNGLWSNTWQPVNGSGGPIYVALTAGSGPLTATQALEADLAGSTDVPQISAVMNAASLASDAPLAPGLLVAISGTGLADGTVEVGGEQLQVLSTGATKIIAVVPSDLAVSAAMQFTIRRGAAISLPSPVLIAAAAPAVFTQDGSGQGPGMITDAASGTLNTPDNPAHAGDTVVISCTGLGSADASAVFVTIGGRNAQTISAAAVADSPGMYQLTAVVPDGVSGTTVPVTITAAGQVSPAVTMELR